MSFSSRHRKLGIKQTIQPLWMDRTVQMMLAGLSEKEIRKELDHYLSTQKQSGGAGERGKKTYGMAISVLSSWISPDLDLQPFRDDLLHIARQTAPEKWVPLHWAIISASYPFWFHVAKQVGRLLNLQDNITQSQVFNRLKEQYGDRETVSRNARYAVRSFIAWGVLQESGTKGCYERGPVLVIENTRLATLMTESALYATPEAKAPLNVLLNHPALFPFQLPAMNGDIIARNNERIESNRFGLDDVTLSLKMTIK